MVVRELLVAMSDAKLVQPPHEPAGPVEQIELILLAAVDVERPQPAEIVRLDFDRNYRVPPPNRPASRINATCRRHRPSGPGIASVAALRPRGPFFAIAPARNSNAACPFA